MRIDTDFQFQVSDRAQAKIRRLARARGDAANAVRVFAERDAAGDLQIGMAFDRARANDVNIPADGVTLLTDPDTLEIAANRHIDYGPDGFTFAPLSGCESLPFAE